MEARSFCVVVFLANANFHGDGGGIYFNPHQPSRILRQAYAKR